MKLYGGCYERFVFGFELAQDGGDGGVRLTQTLSVPGHRNAVKCMHTLGDYMVTGGADDQAHLYNMRSDTDLGFLVNPIEGPIPCVRLLASAEASAQPTHMLSGSVSGPICIWKAQGNWEYIKTMAGHRDIVNALAVHPSASVALSVSRDKQLRLWDLTKGKCAYQAPLGGEGELVEFFDSGDRYAIGMGTQLTLHTTQGEMAGALQHDRKVLCVTPRAEHVLFVGCEGGSLWSWDMRRVSTPLCKLEHAHAARIRGMTECFPLPTSGQRSGIATASSDGVVRVWDCDDLQRQGPDVDKAGAVALASFETGARFTCLCAMPLSTAASCDPATPQTTPKSKRRKKRLTNDAEEGDGGRSAKGATELATVSSVPDAPAAPAVVPIADDGDVLENAQQPRHKGGKKAGKRHRDPANASQRRHSVDADRRDMRKDQSVAFVASAKPASQQIRQKGRKKKPDR